MEKIDIFPVQIIKSKVAEHQAVKDFLMAHALPEFEKNGVNDKTNNTYTDYLPGAYKIYWPFLYNLYKPTIIAMLKELDIVNNNKFDLKMTGWYNFTNYTNTKFVHVVKMTDFRSYFFNIVHFHQVCASMQNI